ncbi:MAG: endonuclease/exonuclease/phosphatase family protein [Planctomycetota bacterium]
MTRSRPIAALCLALFAGCAGSPSPQVAPAAVRLVCWNVHHGRGLDNRVDPDRIAAELRSLEVDLVCLQEVDVGVARSGGIDLPAELAARLGFHAAFGKNIDYQGGDYGNAVLSRWPIELAHNHHYRMLRANEQRGLLQVRVTAGGRVLWVMSTHLDYRPDDAERLSNASEILQRCSELRGAPVIVAGDFNDLPGSPVHQALCATRIDAFAVVGTGTGASYPAATPTKRIDWVLLGNDGSITAIAAKVVDSTASDHRPVVVDLLLR